LNALKLAVWVVQTAGWVAAIVLIGLTSSGIKESSGDIIYVANAVFLLLGGVALGRELGARIERWGNRGQN
jgi:hypothetical protein